MKKEMKIQQEKNKIDKSLEYFLRYKYTKDNLVVFINQKYALAYCKENLDPIVDCKENIEMKKSGNGS